MRKFNFNMLAVMMGTLSIAVGTAIIYLGYQLLGIDLSLYYGIRTFNPTWVVALFLVPFIGGLFVSFIYGLGGKILAYIPALLVCGADYIYLEFFGMVPQGTTLLPLGYWILVVIIAVESAGVGGIIGEVVIKKTYGRSDKKKLHKKYQKRPVSSNT